jgi:hypothetical protein
MTGQAARSARNDPAHRRGRVGCTVAGCPYTLENAGSLPAHLAMAHPDVPMDAIAPRRSASSGDAAAVDQRWLDERIAAIEDGIEAVLDIARNWTAGRNLSRLHPGASAQDYILGRVKHPLGRGVVVPLLAESNWSHGQIAAIAGVTRQRVSQVASDLPPDRGPVLGADNKVYAPRVVQAVVIDTPTAEVEAPADPPPAQDRSRGATAWGRPGMVGADDVSRRDSLAAATARTMVCPLRASHDDPRLEEVVAAEPGGSGIRVRFRCHACRVVFAVSEAELERAARRGLAVVR